MKRRLRHFLAAGLVVLCLAKPAAAFLGLAKSGWPARCRRLLSAAKSARRISASPRMASRVGTGLVELRSRSEPFSNRRVRRAEARAEDENEEWRSDEFAQEGKDSSAG